MGNTFAALVESFEHSALLADAKAWLIKTHPQDNLREPTPEYMARWHTHNLLNPNKPTSGAMGNLVEAFLDHHFVLVKSPYASMRTLHPQFSVPAEDKYMLASRIKPFIYESNGGTANARVALADQIVLLKMYHRHVDSSGLKYPSLKAAIADRVAALCKELNLGKVMLVDRAENMAGQATSFPRSASK